MIDINATLILQTIHFFCAYVILKKLFFAPAVAIVQHERAQEQLVNDQSAAYRADIQKMHQQTAAQWQTYHREFVAQVPSVQAVELFVFREIKPALVAPVFDPEDEHRLEKEVQESIVAAVNHVR